MQSDPPEAQKSTEGMVDYDKNSAMQQQLVKLKSGRIRGLIERLGLVEPELKIVDYGCGPGPTAIDAVKPAIEAYRARFPHAPISVCHADQPGNDWNALFARATGTSGYLVGTDAVRSEAAIGSFYEQMVAESSVALGTCFVASHWLSQSVRLHAPGTVWFADLAGPARAEMAALAQRDWAKFLRCRALELRSGGFLLVSTLGAVPDGGEVNGAAVSGRGTYRAMQVVAQEMANDGLIDQKVLDGFVYGIWFMTAREAGGPLEADPSLAKVFEIEDISVEPAPVNPADLFAESMSDPVEYARLYVGYIRAFGDSSLRTQLFEPCADGQADTNRLAQDFYRRLGNLYQASLGQYACEIWYLTVVLRRS